MITRSATDKGEDAQKALESHEAVTTGGRIALMQVAATGAMRLGVAEDFSLNQGKPVK